jgi:hypothetical protein
MEKVAYTSHEAQYPGTAQSGMKREGNNTETGSDKAGLFPKTRCKPISSSIAPLSFAVVTPPPNSRFRWKSKLRKQTQ